MAKIKFNIDYSKSKGASKEEMDAVARWQQRLGVKVDGVWRKETQNAFLKSQRKANPNSTQNYEDPNYRIPEGTKIGKTKAGNLTFTFPKQPASADTSITKKAKSNSAKKDSSFFEERKNIGTPVKIGDNNLQATISAKGVADDLGLEFAKNPVGKSKEVVESIVNTPWSKLGIVAGSAAAGSIIQKTKLPLAKYIGIALKNIPTAINTYQNLSEDYKDDGKINWGNQIAEVIKNVAAGEVGSFGGSVGKKTINKIGKNLKDDFKAGNPYKLKLKQKLKEAVNETYDNTLIKKTSDKIKLAVRDAKFRLSDQPIKANTISATDRLKKYVSELEKKSTINENIKESILKANPAILRNPPSRALPSAERKLLPVATPETIKANFKRISKTSNEVTPRKFSDATPIPRKTQLLLDGPINPTNLKKFAKSSAIQDMEKEGIEVAKKLKLKKTK